MAVMKVLPPLPRARAYTCTKGCGAPKAKKTSRSGIQNRKRIAVTKPRTPVAIALVRIPFPATMLEDHCQSQMSLQSKP